MMWGEIYTRTHLNSTAFRFKAYEYNLLKMPNMLKIAYYNEVSSI